MCSDSEVEEYTWEDVISAWDFPDANRLFPFVSRLAPRIATLQSRCRRAGVPIIYANDNHGRWRSDFHEQVAAALASRKGAAITEQVHPREGDYFILKPKHSAFFATPLELLLKDLGTREILLCGVTSDQCVLATAAEARMRDLDVKVLSDGTATLSAPRHRRALAHLNDVLNVATPTVASIHLPKVRRSVQSG